MYNYNALIMATPSSFTWQIFTDGQYSIYIYNIDSPVMWLVQSHSRGRWRGGGGGFLNRGRGATLRTDFLSCVRVEVAVLGSPSLIVRTVSVDAKQRLKKKKKLRPSDSSASLQVIQAKGKAD